MIILRILEKIQNVDLRSFGELGNINLYWSILYIMFLSSLHVLEPCIYSHQIHETVRLNLFKTIFPLDFTFLKLNNVY